MPNHHNVSRDSLPHLEEKLHNSGAFTAATRNAFNQKIITLKGFSELDKLSIEEDIHNRKPIGNSIAYRKFLKSIFGTEKGFPLLLDRNYTAIVIAQLGELFKPRKVRLPTREEALLSLRTYQHKTGRGNDSAQKYELNGLYGFAWIDGPISRDGAPFVALYDQGDVIEDIANGYDGHSIIPIFE